MCTPKCTHTQTRRQIHSNVWPFYFWASASAFWWSVIDGQQHLATRLVSDWNASFFKQDNLWLQQIQKRSIMRIWQHIVADVEVRLVTLQSQAAPQGQDSVPFGLCIIFQLHLHIVHSSNEAPLITAHDTHS